MRNITWYVHRLKAMKFGEILWRTQQKFLQRKEYKKYYTQNLPVTDIVINSTISALSPDYLRIGLEQNCIDAELFSSLDLFQGSFSYQQYKKSWNAGFQTENTWDENTFSYKINCAGRIDIGDIRTNWELNRHYQFSALAKSYYISGEKSFLNELADLFQDWNHHNLFLHGVEWTSAMEIAIRVNSWIFTYCFLCMAEKKHGVEYSITTLKNQLIHGVLVMTDYISAHLSRFSSANNHLIIELYAVAMAGILFDYRRWTEFALKKLTEELIRQNYKDGVNKEMSLHYQTFIMEAYGLLMLTMEKNEIKIPDIWYAYLSKMSEFVADCCGDYGETIVFGDNDEGKILDLTGKHFNHYHYVLELMSCVLPQKYNKTVGFYENIRWMVSREQLCRAKKKSAYVSPDAKCYREGGYTLIKDQKRSIFIAIDHADLGYGTLAAHGHADALSFQMYVKGEPIFVDPGSPNYHITPQERDNYRSTYCHNTALVERQNQSEMLGAFLWGRRSKTNLISFQQKMGIKLEAMTEYNGIIHHRRYQYADGVLKIWDSFTGANGKNKEQILLLNPTAVLEKGPKGILIKTPNSQVLILNSSKQISKINNYIYSASYTYATEGKRIEFCSIKNTLALEIQILERKHEGKMCV
ncbi:alginate lyase family protein [Blautia hydrogenotrophica]|uniref:alginate lyase family protein n=1 Tax=Blautia hydrogenotrophica TaxID=53443 RepID=UPI003AB2FBF0